MRRPADGTLTATLCEQLGGSADYDSKIAIYDGCLSIDCPFGGNEIGCNDDDPVNACGTGAGGFHSTATAPVVAGNCYQIRVGGFSADDSGTGNLGIQRRSVTARSRAQIP